MTDRELFEQALEALENAVPEHEGVGWWKKHNKAKRALRERLAQPEQKPVAWGVFDGPNLHDVNFTEEDAQEMVRLKGDGSVVKPLYTYLQPQMQPCAGRNCGSTDPNLHSAECFEDYEKATGMNQRQTLTDERIESVRHMRDVQGYDGNWNYDPYMQGLYNGLEFALSLLEVRQPEFKDAPAIWLGDIKFKRDKLSSGTAHDIEGEKS